VKGHLLICNDGRQIEKTLVGCGEGVLPTFRFKIIISPQVVSPVDSKSFITAERDIVFVCSVMLRFTLENIRNSLTLAVGWKMIPKVDGNRQTKTV
jgi:hypothetical protein